MIRFDRIAHRFDPLCKLLRTWQLEGGISARVTALEIERSDGQTVRLVARQHGAVDLAFNPNIAADEFKLLSVLHAGGLAVPEPYFYDDTGEIFPTPYIVIEFIDGTSEAPPDFTLPLAVELSRIHAIDPADLAFLPRADRKLHKRSAQPDTVLGEERIRAALDAVLPLTPINKSTLLHGDFWHGNLLWKGDQLAAVIDWEDAEIGDPLADLANARLEFLWTFGAEVMRDFTEQYRAVSSIDFTHLRYWDLAAALRACGKILTWGLDPAVERRMVEQHRWFVDQSL